MKQRMKQAFEAITLAVAVVGGAQAQNMDPRDVDALRSDPPKLVAHYGPGPLQVGELRLPAGVGPFPVVVVVHGGCWTKGFATARNTAALATALSKRDGSTAPPGLRGATCEPTT